MEDRLAIALSHDEALVLFEFFSRFRTENRLSLKNNAEFLALSSVSAQIDKLLVEPLRAEYPELLSAARERVAEGFEGLGPGVEP